MAICADDYALTRPISAAILDLAQHGRISAISCMTTSPLWPELGPALRSVADKVDIGLHLTLVDEAPLTRMPRLAPVGRLPSIGRLIAKSYLGLVPRDEVAAELQAQLRAFTAVMGRSPAHIDGHLHTHVLPGIRDLVLDSAASLTPRPWLRTTTDRAVFSRPAGFKAAVLNALGRRFTREARTRGFTTNDGFSGFYDFADGDYASAFPAFLKDLGAAPLILCHPGVADDSAAWAEARGREYDFLKSPAGVALLPSARIMRLSAAAQGNRPA